MMTRATLTERLRAYDRLWRWVLVATCLLVMLIVAAGPQLAQALLEPWWAQPEGPEERKVWALAWTGVATLLMVGVALLGLVLVRWGNRWAPRKFGLLCPSCGAALAGRNRHAALGAGTCGRCQARVVEDAPISLSGAPLPTRDEFLARLEEYKAAYQRHGGWFVSAPLLCFLPGFLAIWPVAALEPFLRPAGLMWLLVLFFFVALGSPFLVYLS
jgi:hypothetical protein